MFGRFLPSRFKAKKQLSTLGVGKIVADLDAIKAEPVGFYLHGKLYVIRPMSLEKFLESIDSYMSLLSLKEKKEITPEELIEKYYNTFSHMIPDLTKEDISNMEQQQVAALYELCMDTITGKVFAPTEKKKLYQTEQKNPPS